MFRFLLCTLGLLLLPYEVDAQRIVVRGRNNVVQLGGGASFSGVRARAFVGTGFRNVGFNRVAVVNSFHGNAVAFRSFGFNSFRSFGYSSFGYAPAVRFVGVPYAPPVALSYGYGGGCDLNALRGYSYAGPPTPLSEETTVTAPDGTITRTMRLFR